MRDGKRISVVVPAHNEETQITKVIETMPDFVDDIIVIDDVSSDATVQVVKDLQATHPRLVLIEHATNKGVGAAITTGYLDALERNSDVIAVMAGDGQMPPDELGDIVEPVCSGKFDYAKANRLASGEAWEVIPKKRFIGNAILTFMTKISSGYYGVTDSQTGFTAISATALRKIDVKRMYPRYGYPNDMLVRLNVVNARVRDVPSRPVYGVGERSGLRIYKVLFTISFLLFRRFWWRMGMKYAVRDFHPLVLFYVLGIFLLTIGLVLGALLIALLLFASGEHHPTAGTAVLVSLAVTTGLMLVLFAMLFDFEHNQSLNPSE